MVNEILENRTAIEGIVNLFIQISILSLTGFLLLYFTRKWNSVARSYLLSGLIATNFLIVGINLYLNLKPDIHYNNFAFTHIKAPDLIPNDLNSVKNDVGSDSILKEKDLID